MRDEGYIKYCSITKEGTPPAIDLIKEVNEARTELFKVGLIGVYPDGVGFGNLSIRTDSTQFVITGSATGDIQELSNEHYALVTSFDIKQNSVTSVGMINASSESMTHGAIYEASSSTQCVIHVHSRELFDYMIEGDYRATPKEVAYGTPAMAESIKELVLATVDKVAIFVTAGHDEGVIAYGPEVDQVKDIILKTYSKAVKNG